jgi:hypothetical protein
LREQREGEQQSGEEGSSFHAGILAQESGEPNELLVMLHPGVVQAFRPVLVLWSERNRPEGLRYSNY